VDQEAGRDAFAYKKHTGIVENAKKCDAFQAAGVNSKRWSDAPPFRRHRPALS
jgi:hypothetical protein